MDFWKLWKPKSVSRLFSRMVLFSTIFTTLVVGGMLVNNQVRNYKRLTDLQRERYVAEQKSNIRDIVLSEARYISLRKKSMEQDYINELKFNIEQACELAEGMINQMKNHSVQEEQKLLKQLITVLKSKDHFSKIFIGSMDGRGIYYPGHPEYENTNLLHHTDIHGNKVIESEIQFLKNNNQGFIYYGQNDTPSAQKEHLHKKVVYLKKFSRWNWYFGGKIYMEDHLPVFQRDIAEKVSSVRFRHSGYIFINQTNGSPIVLDGEVYQGNFNFRSNKDSLRSEIFATQLKTALDNKNGGYFSYLWNKIGEQKLSPKISYVTLVQELNWLVGAGFYLDEIDSELKIQQTVLKENLMNSIVKIGLSLVLVLLLEIFIIYYFEKHYQSDIKKFFFSIKHASENYRKINARDFYFEEFKNTAMVVNSMIDAHEEIHKHLLQEQERAAHSDKLKTAFLSNMSHEIRTPMNAIVGFSDILTDSELEEETKKEILFHIKNSSNQLLKLIDDILDIAKIESNQLKIVRREFQVRPVLQLIEAEIRQLIRQGKSPEVLFLPNYHFDDQLSIYSDEYRLRQILLNLLGNAVKFTSQGSIQLKVEQTENAILFSVIDTGIGISEAEHEIIFERFRQSSNVSPASFGGTGLGLAISKHLVNLLGGEIGLRSEFGKGSKFYFTIPLKS